MKNLKSGKLDAKKILTYSLLLEVLILAGIYVWVYQKYNDKTAQLESQNSTLATRVTQLKEYYDNLDDYNSAIESMTTEINEKLDMFPADIKEEDILVLALDTMKNANVGYTGITVSNREQLFDIEEKTVTDAKLEGYDQAVSFGSRTTQYVNITDYKNLKTIVAIINGADSRRIINTLSYSKNDDGYLEGTIEVKSYFAIGTNKEYVRPVLPEYEAGLFDLFKITTEEETDIDL